MDFLFTHHLVSYEDRLAYVKYCLNNETYNEIKCEEIFNYTNKVTDGINYYDYLRAPWAFKRFKKTNGKILNLIEEQEAGEYQLLVLMILI